MKSIPLILPLMALPISGQAEKRGNVEMPQCPNVVFIYADDIGYGDLSCNGSKTINTPNVQRMATEGVRFTNAHSAAATSTPSRYAMLTGEYAWRREGTGIADARWPICSEMPDMLPGLSVSGIWGSEMKKGHKTGINGCRRILPI